MQDLTIRNRNDMMKNSLSRGAFLFGGFALFFLFNLCGCSSESTSEQAFFDEEVVGKPKDMPPLDQLRSGDVILRLGHGSSSEYFRLHASRNQEFSHCGILYRHRGKWFVLHAELASFRGMDGPVIEGLESFVARSIRWAVYRSTLDDDERIVLCKRALQCVKQHITFDTAFDSTDSTKLYCSEYVAFCHNGVLPREAQIRPTLEMKNTGKRLYLLDDIVEGFTEIARGEGAPF